MLLTPASEVRLASMILAFMAIMRDTNILPHPDQCATLTLLTGPVDQWLCSHSADSGTIDTRLR